jgi:outer membrane lipoprotein-sorting protein
MRILITLLFTALLACAGPALARDPAKSRVTAVHLSAEDQNDVARIESYLNGLHSISADFLQVDDQGGFMHGAIAIQRPGKMRVTYDAPSKDFIIADGSYVHIWNEDLKAQTNVDEDASLAALN